MNNIMTFGNYTASIVYDPDIEMFRGEFIDINGGADFYARDIDGLKREGQISLDMFIDMCKKDGAEPRRKTSGKFALRLPAQVYQKASIAAKSENKSLNAWISERVSEALD
jgi:predicted HicB family RNase H-like nuclease